jgi:hypothetical protein
LPEPFVLASVRFPFSFDGRGVARSRAGKGVVNQADKFREYARRITHESMKFEARGKLRMREAKDPESWYRLDSISCKRFVLKIMKIVEGFE